MSYANAEIRVAILDNFHYQKYVTTNYKSYYQKGLDLFANQAQENGYGINYKIFQYDQSPLSIIDKINEVKAWKADVILGPRDSNKFLLLSDKIDNTLTISPFATSISINKMPDNFHSLTLLDNYSALAMYRFITSALPNKNIYVITEANCKSCIDVSDELIKLWEKHKGTQVNQKFYIEDHIPDAKTLLKDYHKGDIIVLPNMAHSSAVLMATITNELDSPITFIGGDGWGAWNDTEAGKLKSNKLYTAFHIVPWGLYGCNTKLLEFTKLYKEYFQEAPVDKLSYLSYSSLNSIIVAYRKFGSRFNGSIKEKILSSYRYALSQDPYFFKPTNYLVYRIENSTNSLDATVNVITGKTTEFFQGNGETETCAD